MNKDSVYSVWKISIKCTKTPVLFVETEVLLMTLYRVVIVVLMIISQLDHTDTAAHSTTDMKLPTQPVVPLVTQLVPNVTVLLKLIVLLVSQMLLGLMTIQLPECVKIMVVMILSNAPQVGTMMKTELIYVLEMNGPSEPMLVKLVVISLVNQPLII
jgi:hypothetical protein